MAHRPIFRPDPPQLSQLAGTEAFSRTESRPVDDDGTYLAELAAKLAAHPDPDSNELALDLLLHQIVEQACQETGASGAAIALTHDAEIVCRATLGESAPDLGVRLSTRSGLSGACYQTRQMQCCNDTEIDPRVDAAACRQLAIRSIVVLPVLDVQSGERLGVFELYASRPQAFREREIQALQTLCRRIAENVRHASVALPMHAAPSFGESAATPMKVEEIKVAIPANAEIPSPQHELPSLAPRIREVPPEEPRLSSFRPFGARRHRDYWTGVLTVIVLSLAMLLGWMVGRRASWHTPQQIVVTPAVRVAPQVDRVEKKAAVEAVPPQQVQSSPQPVRRPVTTGISQAVTRSVTRSKSSAAENPAGDLVVYENGKVIFRMPPNAAGPAAPSDLATSAAQAGDAAGAGTPVTLSAEAANAYLIQRVDPQYPETAKQQGIQGPVVLDVLVGGDGAVHEVKVISGDPQLASAAAAAVRQWRYRPYAPQGQPVDFTTRVTVNFTLP